MELLEHTLITGIDKMSQAKKISEEQLANRIYKENMKMMSSPEWVWDNLTLFGDVAAGDEKYKQIIVECITKLPFKVRERVLDNVTFIMLSEDILGHHFIMNSIKNSALAKRTKIGNLEICEHEIPIILLNFVSMKNKKKTKIISNIAHEIAHFILGHDSCRHTDRNLEKEADDLCQKWGFERAYKNYEQFGKKKKK